MRLGEQLTRVCFASDVTVTLLIGFWSIIFVAIPLRVLNQVCKNRTSSCFRGAGDVTQHTSPPTFRV